MKTRKKNVPNDNIEKINVQRKALDIYVRGIHTYYKEAFISITNNNITNRLLIFHT